MVGVLHSVRSLQKCYLHFGWHADDVGSCIVMKVEK